MRKYLPTNYSNIKIILTILALLIYIITNSSLPNLIGSSLFNYLIKPSMWLGLASIIWLLPRTRPKSLLKFQESVYWWAFTFALVYIVVLVLAGFIDGLGKSPYSHTPKWILINFFSVGSFLLGSELMRSYFVNSFFTKKENYLLFILVAMFMTFLSTSFGKLIKLKDYVDIVKYVAQYLAPDFAKNLFATYLAFLGGPLASLIYIGVIEGFHWFSPILPNLKWITTALVGILIPVFSLSLMQMFYLTEARLIKEREQDQEGPFGWMITSIFSIVIVWFAVGVFPVYPSVIATGSMEPMIKPGDVILVDKATDINDIYSLKVGDVIQFTRDNILISHRIIEIKEEENVKMFYTKGDNNSAVDFEPVHPEQVKGKIIKVIPKVGWPTLLIKTNKNIDLEGIVF
ncbi:MAG: signal peptidase I [Clostridia bacterium]|jgi:signal peptidase|nr:signal peptidase I [Clostridia bacterium]